MKHIKFKQALIKPINKNRIMKPIKFKEQNVVYAKNQPEYIPLPAFKNNSEKGEVISCWHLSFMERVRLLFTGRIWLSLCSFNQPLTPSLLTAEKYDIFLKQKKEFVLFKKIAFCLKNKLSYSKK
jgi:hypothetical protein